MTLMPSLRACFSSFVKEEIIDPLEDKLEMILMQLLK